MHEGEHNAPVWMHCENKTQQIGLNHDYNMTFLISPCECWYSLINRYSHSYVKWCPLTHWGRVTHICVSKLTIIGLDNGLSPGRRQAIIWTNAGIKLIGPLGTNLSEILIEIFIFSFKKMHLKMSSGKWRPSCLGLNVLTTEIVTSQWLSSRDTTCLWCATWHLYASLHPHCGNSTG